MARKKVQAPRTAEALRQQFPYVEGGMSLSLEDNIVPVAVVADVTAVVQGAAGVQRFYRAAPFTSAVGSTPVARIENPAGSGVLMAIERIQAWGGGTLAPNVGLLSAAPTGGSMFRGWPRDKPGDRSAGRIDVGNVAIPITISQLYWFAAPAAATPQLTIGSIGAGVRLATLRPGSRIDVFLEDDSAQAILVNVAWTETPITQ